MIPRLYCESDFEALKVLYKGDLGDLDPKRDFIVVVENDGRIVGAVAARPVAWLHGMAVDQGLSSRLIAEIMMSYCYGHLAAKLALEALWVVDQENRRMLRWLERHKAVKQSGQAFTMEIK